VTAAGENGANASSSSFRPNPKSRTTIDLVSRSANFGGQELVVSETARARSSRSTALPARRQSPRARARTTLISVGTPGCDQSRLRIVGDHLVALTGHAVANAPSSALAGVDINGSRRSGYYTTTCGEPPSTFGTHDGRLAPSC